MNSNFQSQSDGLGLDGFYDGITKDGLLTTSDWHLKLEILMLLNPCDKYQFYEATKSYT